MGQPAVPSTSLIDKIAFEAVSPGRREYGNGVEMVYVERKK
jgi:hypothetical protein